MNREQAKELLPFIQAFAEGKEIECREEDKWYKVLEICNEMNPQDYRIKPEPKYRPFANAEECWVEMQKHQPFGWLKSKKDGYYSFITMLNYRFRLNGYDGWRFDDVINKFTFADCTPFGVKVEE